MASGMLLRLAVASFFVAAADIEASERTYAGMFTSSWQTVGWHGHDQPPCAQPHEFRLPGVILHETPVCDSVDFARGNLDNNIGFRAGREWDLWRNDRLALVVGTEGSFSNSEYNLSQSDFVLASATAIAGADLRVGRIAAGGRGGVGPFASSDGREYGLHRTFSSHLTLPLTQGSALRIARTITTFHSKAPYDVFRGGEVVTSGPRLFERAPTAHEISFLIVTSPEYVGSTKWEFASSTGTTNPGGPLGSSRQLRISNFSQLTAACQLPWQSWEGRFTWTAAAHESSRPTVFLGYDNNFRSKTIQSVGAAARRSFRTPFPRLTLHAGSGLEIADWSDEHHLLTRDGETLEAGIEWAVTAQAAVRWHLAPNVALEGTYEKAYWRNIDLGENRVGFGLVITSFSTPPYSRPNR